MHGIFSEYYFDLAVAMLLFGLLGVMLAVDEYHVASGLLVTYVMIIFMVVSDIMLWSIILDDMCLWILSGYYDYFHDGIWYYFGVLPWILRCLWIISG